MEKSQSIEHLTMSSRSGTNNKLLMVAAIIAVLLSVIAIIVALVVSVGKIAPTNINVSSSPANIGSSGSDDDDNKIWLLSFEHLGLNIGYIDEATGEIKGFSIDVANAVCEIANKNCQTVYDSPERCWDPRAGSIAPAGEGIMAGYYDACVGWFHTYERHRTLRFSDPYTVKHSTIGFITLAGNPESFNWLNLTGKIIGFLEGPLADEECVGRVDGIQGNDLSPDQIRHYAAADYYSMYEALNDGEIDAVFYDAVLIGPEYSLVSDLISDCTIAGLSVMTRKDNRLVDWWNPAFEKLKSSSQWRDICNDLTEEHGHIGGFDAEFCITD